MAKRPMTRAGAVIAASAALLLGLSGVAHADGPGDRWYGEPVNMADYPDCGEALAKYQVSVGAGALGGPVGMIAGAATGLPDVYLDCPPAPEYWHNGT